MSEKTMNSHEMVFLCSLLKLNLGSNGHSMTEYVSLFEGKLTDPRVFSGRKEYILLLVYRKVEKLTLW